MEERTADRCCYLSAAERPDHFQSVLVEGQCLDRIAFQTAAF